MAGKIVVVGSSNTDMVVKSHRLPTAGETVTGGQFVMAPGGKGANQAVACAKLGGEVQFLGKMGQDVFQEQLTASLRKDGVHLDHLLIDPAASTGIALITVDGTGQNQILVASGSNMKLTPADVEVSHDDTRRALD